MPSQKTFRTKVKLAKAQKQNRMTWPRAIQQSARSRLKAATRPTTPWSYPKMLATLVALPPSHRYHQHYDRQTVHAVHPTYLQRSDNPVTNRKDDCDSSRLSMLDERDAQKAARHDAHSCEAAMLSRPGAGVAQDAHHKAVDRTTSIFDRLWHSYSCIGAIDRPASLRRTLDPDTLFIGLRSFPIPNWFRMKADNKIQYNAKRRHWRRTKLNI
ncbi:uncharacterized protein PAN0_002c1400 [Moesziomyces antarcticus]|uniref:uncharacterized protein n=1 Tax=Pseudozyma antarctica TaxID=84753 RepID=UPI00071956AA|nr:uncharacterized protein PAN0_002c1400 [Moesziomyces antarcticus]GAK63197.1 hypothetical protein PAN0_002c1400 [Moesziomyces antarcticus]